MRGLGRVVMKVVDAAWRVLQARSNLGFKLLGVLGLVIFRLALSLSEGRRFEWYVSGPLASLGLMVLRAVWESFLILSVGGLATGSAIVVIRHLTCPGVRRARLLMTFWCRRCGSGCSAS